MGMRTILISSVVAVMAAQCAVAQDGPPRDRRGPRHGDEPVLRGPRVRTDKVPGMEESFGGQGRVERAMGLPVPPRIVYRSLMSLRGPDAPPELRLTEDQEAALKRLEREFTDRQRAYQREHAQEIENLRGPGPDGQGEGRRGPGGPPPMEGPRGGPDGQGEGRRGPGGPPPMEGPRGGPDGQGDGRRGPGGPPPMEGPRGEGGRERMSPEAARARMEEIGRGAPNPADQVNQMWPLLNQAQREKIKGDIDRYLASENERMTEAYVDRRARERNAEGQQPGRLGADRPGPQGDGPRRPRAEGPDQPPPMERPPAPEGAGQPGDGPGRDGQISEERVLRRLPEQLRERIKNLPAEERSRILQRMGERMRRAQQEGQGGR